MRRHILTAAFAAAALVSTVAPAVADVVYAVAPPFFLFVLTPPLPASSITS